jgi:hypothetical protein
MLFLATVASADENDYECTESRDATLCITKHCETMNNSTCNCYAHFRAC